MRSVRVLGVVVAMALAVLGGAPTVVSADPGGVPAAGVSAAPAAPGVPGAPDRFDAVAADVGPLGAYVGLNPARLADTRPGERTIDGIAAGGGAVGAAALLTVPVRGRGGVPGSGVDAVALNVTAVGASQPSHLTVYPSGANRPLASNLNFVTGQTIPNMVIAKLGADGSVAVFNAAGSTHVVVDVLGWVAPGAGFTALTPARLADSRPGEHTIDEQAAGTGKLPGGGYSPLRVVGRGGVPTVGVGAVVLNVTVVDGTAPTHLTVYPSRRARPLASNLNAVTGQTIPNMVIAKVGPDGLVNIFNAAGAVHVVVDVLGWYSSPPPPTTMDGWEARWAEQRAAVVANLAAQGAGRTADGRTVRGVGGFSIDLSACPAGWSDTEGLTNTQIKLGMTAPLTGPMADYGNIARAMQVQINALNAAGGITDSLGRTRTVSLVVHDDGYDPTRTIPLVDSLLDADKVFAMVTTGTPGTMSTYDKLNQRCVPQPFALTGHPAWADPAFHPWTTGLPLSNATEALFWMVYIEVNIDQLAPNGGVVDVAALVIDNDFGRLYDKAMRALVAGSRFKDRIAYTTQLISPTATSVAGAMAALTATNPEVFIAMTGGTTCVAAIQQATALGMNSSVPVRFLPSVCQASSFVSKAAVGSSGAQGWMIVNGGLKDLNSSRYNTDPYVLRARNQLSAAGYDPAASGSFGTGYAAGWPQLQALRIAAALPGGLTRSNLMIAIRAMDMTHPMLVDGVGFNLYGSVDARPIEGGVYQSRNTATETWQDMGGIVELSGRSTNCRWDRVSGVCI